jgi:hypothetical protein
MSALEIKTLEILVNRFQTLYFTKNLAEDKKELYQALAIEVAGIACLIQRAKL